MSNEELVVIIKKRISVIENDRTLHPVNKRGKIAELKKIVNLISIKTDSYSDYLRCI